MNAESVERLKANHSIRIEYDYLEFELENQTRFFALNHSTSVLFVACISQRLIGGSATISSLLNKKNLIPVTVDADPCASA
jgi:hypothetical protein